MVHKTNKFNNQPQQPQQPQNQPMQQQNQPQQQQNQPHQQQNQPHQQQNQPHQQQNQPQQHQQQNLQQQNQPMQQQAKQQPMQQQAKQQPMQSQSRQQAPFSFFPRLWDPRSLWQSSMSRFPAFWEDMENSLADLTQEANNLSVYDDGQNVIVEAALPGLSSNEINITLDKGVLKIWGEKSEENEDPNKKYLRRASSSYSYRVKLPEEIDENVEPKTSFKNGIALLTFPKRAESKAKQIKLKND